MIEIMEKEFNELRELLLSIDGKHFTWNDARASVLNQLHDLQSKAENLPISDVIHRSAVEKFNDEYSWEYNLRQVVRWEHEEADDDVNFYIKHWLEKIVEQEGYKLVKNGV